MTNSGGMWRFLWLLEICLLWKKKGHFWPIFEPPLRSNEAMKSKSIAKNRFYIQFYIKKWQPSLNLSCNRISVQFLMITYYITFITYCIGKCYSIIRVTYEIWRVFTENLETESNQIDVVTEKVREVIKMESKNPAHLFHLLEIYRAIVILL